MALDECVDDSWSLVPPDGIADEDDIVGGDIQFCVFQCRTSLRVVHFHRTARLPVVPVEVIGGVDLLRDNLVQGAARDLRNRPGCLGCRAGG